MPTTANPFTPSFGITPPLLVGRDMEITALRRALVNGPGDPARAMLLTGQRGTGKTVLLNALEDTAAELGWMVVSEIVQPGLAEELTRTVFPQMLAALDPDHATSSVTGVSASVLGIGGGLTRQVVERYPIEPSLRQQLEALARLQAQSDKGVFISLDEVHRDEINELKPLFHAIQQCFRQGLPVAFCAAGLPAAISGLLSENVLTYLRRADRFQLGPVPDALVSAGLAEPIERAGRTITKEALGLAVDAIQGYPFLIQVVGFELWEANRSATEIGADAAETAVLRAAGTARRLVHEPALADLSEADRRFLIAMAHQGAEPVRIASIMAGLGATRDHVNKYRSRLIAAEVVEPAGRGLLRFTIPFLADHLRSLDS
ncbi:MAG: ATP-binding protein [Bifidobacteriaceae bacterium]|nr:ATP-binding protein [Bifidobacteriaceae bacterium]